MYGENPNSRLSLFCMCFCMWTRALQPNVLIVYLSVFSSMAACHFCFMDLCVKEWLVPTAAQIELVINQSRLRVPPCANWNMHKRTASHVTTCLSVFVPVSPCTLNMAACVCVHSCLRVSLGSGMFLCACGGPLSARWMVSASVSKVTAGWPALCWLRVWILSFDSSWWVFHSPSPTRKSLHHGNSQFTRQINDASIRFF